jgi:hypothetical protein
MITMHGLRQRQTKLLPLRNVRRKKRKQDDSLKLALSSKLKRALVHAKTEVVFNSV